MFDSLTTDLGSRFMIAAGGVAIGLVLLVIILMVLRRRNAPLFVRGGKSREPRLAVLDAAAVDTRRRLVLIRRDDIEHLIMIGGPTDIVIESGIGLALPQAQSLPVQIPQAATPVLKTPDPVVSREPEIAPPVITQTRTAPSIAAEPAPVRVAEPAPARAEPVAATPVRSAERIEPAVIPPAANAIPAAAIVQPVVAARPAPQLFSPIRWSSPPCSQCQPPPRRSIATRPPTRKKRWLADMLTRAQENRAAAGAQQRGSGASHAPRSGHCAVR